jgi:hypothetical protein
MNKRKNKETTFQKTFRLAVIISAFFGFGELIILGLYKSMDTIIERIFVIMMGIFLMIPLVPIVCSFIFNFILGCNKPSDTNSKSKNYYEAKTTPKSKTTTKSNNTKLKVVKTQGYEEFKNELTSCVKNGLLTRETILKLKCELRYRIGTHIEVYKDFNFENDMHEIYVLGKSSVLTKEDYEYLTKFISNNLNFPKEA